VLKRSAACTSRDWTDSKRLKESSLTSWPTLRTVCCEYEPSCGSGLRTFRGICKFSSYITSVVVFPYNMPKRIILLSIVVNTQASKFCKQGVSAQHDEFQHGSHTIGEVAIFSRRAHHCGNFFRRVVATLLVQGKSGKHVLTCTCCHKQVTRGQDVYLALNGCRFSVGYGLLYFSDAEPAPSPAASPNKHISTRKQPHFVLNCPPSPSLPCFMVVQLPLR